MQFLLLLLYSLWTLSSSLGAHYAGKYIDPAFPGKCVLNNLILSVGEVHNDIEKCERTSCTNNTWAEYYSCGVSVPSANCKIGDRKHPSAPYPDCCEHHIVCNNTSV